MVGDDAQAIYAFRAATVRNMLDFPSHFPGTTIDHPGAELPLDPADPRPRQRRPRRGGRGLRQAAVDRRTAGGGRPVLATCPDEPAQAMAVGQTILEHHESGVALREQAVLFRSAHHSDLLEVELRRRRIPFVKYGGLRFLEAAHVRDLLAALRLLENPRDELAWIRLLQLVDGIGPGCGRRRCSAISGVRDPDPGADPLARFCEDPAELRRRAGGGGRLPRWAAPWPVAGPTGCPPAGRWSDPCRGSNP